MHVRIVPLAAAAIGSVSSSAMAAIVSDGSFETTAVATYTYNPAGIWTFAGNSGLNRPPSDFGAPAAPSGLQMAFLQTDSANAADFGRFSQSITLPFNGNYSISYLDSGRQFSGYGGNVSYEILLDSTVIASMATVSGQPFTPQSIPFSANAGAYTLMFRIVSTQPLGDNTAFFDSVDIVPGPGSISLLAIGCVAFARRRR